MCTHSTWNNNNNLPPHIFVIILTYFALRLKKARANGNRQNASVARSQVCVCARARECVLVKSSYI